MLQVQVTGGGVPLTDIDLSTMESKVGQQTGAMLLTVSRGPCMLIQIILYVLRANTCQGLSFVFESARQYADRGVV
jgi:hypothetical protein